MNRVPISRRKLLGKLGAAAVASAGLNSLAGPARLALSPVTPSLPAGGTIFLNRNENAYGPSEQVVQAMQRSMAHANRFPRMAWAALASQIAALHKVKPEQVVVGCGSTEILKSAASAFLGPGQTLLLSSPTFDIIAEYATTTGATIVPVLLDRF